MISGTRFAKTLAKRILARANLTLGNYQDKVFILGDGRSGTNWLIDILNFDKRYRLIYEPFHGWEFRPKLPDAAEYPSLGRHDPGSLATQFKKASQGSFITKNVTIEFPRPLYEGLMIKDVNAHLVLDELDLAIPDMRKLMIIRHPFSVAHSKLRYRAHDWPTSPGYFLAEAAAGRTILDSQRKLIETVEQDGDRWLQLILVWCILHTFALQSESIESYQFVCYEHLLHNPEREIAELYRALRMEERYTANAAAIMAAAQKPSRVTEPSNVIETSRQGKYAWQENMSGEMIDRGMEILRAFSFDRIYGKGFEPELPPSDLMAALKI